ncbi:MAG TPA: sugar phosphate nucleotidyltransferase [Gemmatimonadaceae bacterium]|nr:sugar phosphate nucleotidyltransferase [Gemmatimonadaceae bacterium]
MTRWAVVLAGGVGSRFWPLSTQERPKQLLPLVGNEPLLVEQLQRLRPLVEPKRTLVLTNAGLVDAIARVAPEIPRANIIAEPRPAGTAAALAWAANVIEQRDGADATMISVHADWAIADADGFRAALSQAADAAEEHRSLVTVGIVPTRPDPGFGYIEPGDVVSAAGRGVRRVARFVEKPSRERAVRMKEQGYLWNSGIFVWRVGAFLTEVRTHAKEVAPALAQHSGGLGAFFGAITNPISVDHAVLERSQRVLVLAGDFGWDDVGTWGALQRVRDRDASGNAVSGSVHALDATNNVVHAEGQHVVLYGVKDLVVIARDGLTVVTTIDASADLKRLVESLPAGVREGGATS